MSKACGQEGESLIAMVEGWLDTNFKKVVSHHIDCLLKEG